MPQPSSCLHIWCIENTPTFDYHWFSLFLAKFPEKTVTNMLQALNNLSKRSRPNRYPVPKLYNLFLVHEITKLHQAEAMVVNVVNPRMCASDIGCNHTLSPIVFYLYHNVAWLTSKGTLKMVYAVLHDTPGAYISAGEIRKPLMWSHSKEVIHTQKKAWDDMAEVWRAVALAFFMLSIQPWAH
ncbi:hypothetical protein B0H10DRAFT_1067118 [Mycena sp. CBHHK59/15]|nr:hypothetical protein B0H10DRAFT_1067118 [Mycena sp. CBHHK59/15]